MGKLLVLLVVLTLMTLLVALITNALSRRQDRTATRIRGSKKRMAALEATRTRHVAALKEIRDLANSSEAMGGDPLWSLVADKIDVALNDRNEDAT